MKLTVLPPNKQQNFEPLQFALKPRKNPKKIKTRRLTLVFLLTLADLGAVRKPRNDNYHHYYSTLDDLAFNNHEVKRMPRCVA